MRVIDKESGSEAEPCQSSSKKGLRGANAGSGGGKASKATDAADEEGPA